MKKLLTLLMVMAGMCAFAQTQPTLPAGSQIYSSNLFIAPDSSVWTGKAGMYTNLGSWEKVKSLVAIPNATIQAYSADTGFNFESPTYNTFSVTPTMRDKYGNEPRFLLQIRKGSDPENEWVDSMEGFQRIRGVNGEVTAVRFQTSGYPAILVISR